MSVFVCAVEFSHGKDFLLIIREEIRFKAKSMIAVLGIVKQYP